MNFQVGDQILGYEVVGVLGAGGMGEVYKVRNVISDRVEAMKVLLADLHNQRELADRFLREIKVQARLAHPNIAGLHTAFEFEGKLLMILELVEGMTLSDRLKQGPVPLEDAADYTSQALNALDYAHRLGVIHRDIKPANMMVGPDGTLKLMDFGIAKAVTDKTLTRTGSLIGSLHYMSPEQVQGHADLDARTDIYSLGVVLYEMATGRRPFDGNSEFSIMKAHLEEPPVPPAQVDSAIPPELSQVILAALAKQPGDRLQTAGEFKQALEDVRSFLVPHETPSERRARGESGERWGGETADAGLPYAQRETEPLSDRRHEPVRDDYTVYQPPDRLPQQPELYDYDDAPVSEDWGESEQRESPSASRRRLQTITPVPEPPAEAPVAPPQRRSKAPVAVGLGLILLLALVAGFQLPQWFSGSDSPDEPQPETIVAESQVTSSTPAPGPDSPSQDSPSPPASASNQRVPDRPPPSSGDPATPKQERASSPTSSAKAGGDPSAARDSKPADKPTSSPTPDETSEKAAVSTPAPASPANNKQEQSDSASDPDEPTQLAQAAPPSQPSSPAGASAESKDTARVSTQIPAARPSSSAESPGSEKTSPPPAPAPETPPSDEVFDYRDPRLSQKPQLVHQVQPQYTQEARAARVQGRVVLEAEIWPDGRPHNIRVTRSIGDSGLDQNAVKALEQWRFAAGTMNGRPVKVRVPIALDFRLF